MEAVYRRDRLPDSSGVRFRLESFFQEPPLLPHIVSASGTYRATPAGRGAVVTFAQQTTVKKKLFWLHRKIARMNVERFFTNMASAIYRSEKE